MATVEMYRTSAPTETPHDEMKGVAISAPYNEEFHPRIKQLPEWAWEWRGDEEVWVVDVIVWEEWVAPLLREVYGEGYDGGAQKSETGTGKDASGDGEDRPQRQTTAPDTQDLFESPSTE